MRFYTQRHRHYVGVDLHARSMYVCVLDNAGKVLAHRKLPTDRQAFPELLRPYRKDPVVAVECLFCWYWLSDLCAEEGIAFVLGHALFMKAIHGGKSKNDRIDHSLLPRARAIAARRRRLAAIPRVHLLSWPAQGNRTVSRTRRPSGAVALLLGGG